MNTADVAAEVKCLRRLIGMRCSNVYDLSPKVIPPFSFFPFSHSFTFLNFIRFDFPFLQTYVFKLMNSSGVSESGESEKVLLLMESGVRLHSTIYMRDKSNTPSGFTLKLRKHIRTRRLEDVRQLGYDRVYSITLLPYTLFISQKKNKLISSMKTVADYSLPIWTWGECKLCYIGAVCSGEYPPHRF